MRRSTLIAITAGSALLAPAPAAQANQSRSCSNVRGAEVIFAVRVSCSTAHKVARAWVAGYRRDGRSTRTAATYRCRNRPDEFEGDVIFCRKGRRSVRFYPNVRRP